MRDYDVVLVPVTVRGNRESWDRAERIVRQCLARSRLARELGLGHLLRGTNHENWLNTDQLIEHLEKTGQVDLAKQIREAK